MIKESLIKPLKIADLPFNQHIGLESDGDMVLIKQQQYLLNHVGSLHASVIHGLAEGASGHYLIQNLLPLFPQSLVLVKNASMQYKRPAMQECQAKAKVSDAALQHCIDTLKRRNRAILNIPVTVLCEHKIIATAEFDWWLRVPK
ncbi:MAG: YiiD C-terminal domain-containing protein [Mariprofundus sp.]|nr:YiiD C-terminal domain-containing protein [Mariprofundus sp.]